MKICSFCEKDVSFSEKCVFVVPVKRSRPFQKSEDLQFLWKGRVLFRKVCFYCVNTSYPMDNCFNRSARPVLPNVGKRRPVKLSAGPVTECAFARWRKVYHFLSGHNDVIASFLFGVKECADVFQQRYILKSSILFYFK